MPRISIFVSSIILQKSVSFSVLVWKLWSHKYTIDSVLKCLGDKHWSSLRSPGSFFHRRIASLVGMQQIYLILLCSSRSYHKLRIQICGFLFQSLRRQSVAWNIILYYSEHLFTLSSLIHFLYTHILNAFPSLRKYHVLYIVYFILCHLKSLICTEIRRSNPNVRFIFLFLKWHITIIRKKSVNK